MHKIVNEEELNLVSGAGFFKFLIDSLLLGGKEDSFGGFILSGGCNKSRIEKEKKNSNGYEFIGEKNKKSGEYKSLINQERNIFAD